MPPGPEYPRRLHLNDDSEDSMAEAKQVSEAEYGHHPVCAPDGYGYQSGWFGSVDDLREWCEDEGHEVPETVHGTSPTHLSITAQHIVDDALEEHHEDATVDRTEIARLQAFLDQWCAAQNVVTWWDDPQIVVRLDRQEAP